MASCRVTEKPVQTPHMRKLIPPTPFLLTHMKTTPHMRKLKLPTTFPLTNKTICSTLAKHAEHVSDGHCSVRTLDKGFLYPTLHMETSACLIKQRPQIYQSFVQFDYIMSAIIQIKNDPLHQLASKAKSCSFSLTNQPAQEQ
jgi:hypothetical protein